MYHHNDFESAAAAYRIGISIKNWVTQCVACCDFGCVGPIVPWFADGFVMEAVFFVRCDA